MKSNNAPIIALVVIVVLVGLFLIYRKLMEQLFQYPVGGKITSPFGHRGSPTAGASTDHNGVDFSAPTGTPVKAPLKGKILMQWNDAAGGNQMRVVHDKGWITGYAHLSGYNKKVGDAVDQFDVIGFTGNTGNTTGPHLHFTLTNPKGIKVDPALYKNKKLT